jgi:hypothetical protein
MHKLILDDLSFLLQWSVRRFNNYESMLFSLFNWNLDFFSLSQVSSLSTIKLLFFCLIQSMCDKADWPSVSCPGDISSDESSDDDVSEVQKTVGSDDDVKLATLKKATKSGKRKYKDCCSATGAKEEKNPFFWLYKKTCLKIQTAAEKISTSVEASTHPTNLVPTIKGAMQMVKDCGVQEKTALVHTAILLIMKPEFREVFSSLETNEGRFDLLEREHEKESMKRR